MAVNVLMSEMPKGHHKSQTKANREACGLIFGFVSKRTFLNEPPGGSYLPTVLNVSFFVLSV